MASCSRKAKNAEGESKQGPNWLELPRDVTQNILQRLHVVEIVTSACIVCPLWWNICKEPIMWRTIDMSNLRISRYELVKICMYAVDRSCGQMEYINVEYFGNDDLLEYIADCTTCLRCLRLPKCWSGISSKGMSKVAKKLPTLEELDISGNKLSSDTLEVIGRCCSLLKSLKFVSEFSSLTGCDEDALAIAKTMPNLRCLQISGKRLSDVGVFAILDGCPLLQSLDLGCCYRLVLSESLRLRCHEQIKDLLLPSHVYYPDDDTDSDDYYDDCYMDTYIDSVDDPSEDIY